MLLVLLAIACLVSVPLRGGRLRRLGDIRLRAEWAALGALAVQVLVLGLFTGGAAWWHAIAHVATYGLAAWFVWANRAIPGVVLIAVGGAANLLAIVANGGVMPTSAWAQRAAGLQSTDVFANSAVRDHPHLLWLGDVIPVPLPLGLSNVLSVGDLLIYAGALVLLDRVCVRTIAPVPWSLAPGPQGPSLVETDDGGAQLYFSRQSPTVPGDIYVSEDFGPADPVTELNSADNDIQPNVRKDGREVVFSSNHVDPGAQGGQDIYVATRASADDPWGQPANLGTAVNAAAGETRPSLSWDARTLLFGRAPGPEGMSDIYISTRE